MSTTNGPNKGGINPDEVTLLTRLDSYIRFNRKTSQIINSFDDQVLELYKLDQDIENILKVVKAHNIPGVDLTKKNLHTLLLSIMANMRASRSHYISLRAIIEILNDFISFSQCS